LGDQSREEARLGERRDELGGIGALAVERAPIFAWVLGAERAYRLADLRELVGYGLRLRVDHLQNGVPASGAAPGLICRGRTAPAATTLALSGFRVGLDAVAYHARLAAALRGRPPFAPLRRAAAALAADFAAPARAARWRSM